MAQHDYVIANGTGAAVRSDLNNGLSAIVTQNSGATEPATTYAFMRWADTTAGVMKMRNSANNAWITLYQLDGEWTNIAFENGTAAAPSIYFKDSGTDTGFYSPGANQVGISTGGTARLTIDSNGNVDIDSNTLYVDATNNRVGLGSSSPSTNFELRGSGASIAGVNAHALISDSTTAASGVGGSILFEGNYTSGGARAAFGAIAGTKENGTDSNYAGNLKFYTRANGSLPALAMTIDSSQRVGIGVTGPSSLLHAKQDQAATTEIRLDNASSSAGAYAQLRVTGNGVGLNLGVSNTGSGGTGLFEADYGYLSTESIASGLNIGTITGPVRFFAGSSSNERARIDSSGRLLVGTSSSSTADTLVLQNNSSSSNDVAVVRMRRGGTPSSSADIGLISFEDGSGNVGASIRVTNDTASSWGSGDYPARIVFSTCSDSASSPSERARITSGGYLKASPDATYNNSAGAYHEFSNNLNNNAVAILRVNNTSFADYAFTVGCYRSANSAYSLAQFMSGDGSTNPFSDREFNLRGDGQAYADGSWNGGGADYAEYFEWSDGNPDEEDRRGISVVLDGDQIRPAVDGEDPIGVISGNPSVVGDAAWNKWSGKYLRDDYGTYIQEDYEVVNDVGETVIQQRRKLNSAYDPDQEYVSREDRPEWDCVGLMGKLRIRKGQPTGTRWIKMRDISDSVEEWLVR